ncbi:MarR family transcriptional regulator [Blastococcus sp. KM273128]|uniref:MarR family winged helix-turn-helix transcriptional regulator n=1 Tax=Blastococcus sp. KM273128 TaxID=2570314 RepID=UPI001F01DECB|nr:MarR family transcriptional regulator [Blastococcus sp. KM273128]MCF6745912.1 MarR family transcriptional regulator [Blastococcus sp. KM273128]
MQQRVESGVSDPLERIERELTLLVQRAQRVHLHAESSAQPLERSAYLILGRLRDEGPLRNGALAALLGLDASTVSRHVASLQQAGLIAREADPEDGRACRLRLTATGHRAVAATRKARRGLVRELLNSWPADDRRTLAALLERLNAGLDARLAGARTGNPPLSAQSQIHVSV